MCFKPPKTMGLHWHRCLKYKSDLNVGDNIISHFPPLIEINVFPCNSDLFACDLSINKLHGPIPASLFNLDQLTHL